MKGVLTHILFDVINVAYPKFKEMDLTVPELLATISYILDGKQIESQEDFEHYLLITSEINKLLANYYHKKAVDTPLFSVDGMLSLSGKDASFFQGPKFKLGLNNRREYLIKQFEKIPTILEYLQYQEESVPSQY